MNIPRGRMWYAPLLLACGAMLLLVSLAAIAFLVWLRPAAQDWQQAVRLGPITLQVGVEKMLRVVSRRQVAWLLDGCGIHTASGIWRLSAAHGETTLICEPCLVRHRSLGPGGVRLDRVSISLERDQGSGSRARYSGQARLQAGAREIALPWTGVVTRRNATVDISTSGLEMPQVIAVLGHDLPETGIVRITGQLSMQLQIELPARKLATQWALEDFRVGGLGTENLLNASLPPQCGAPSHTVSGWLPTAVVAAEDQRFRSHPGYDARQINAALRSNIEDRTLHGASTLTQQLARLLYTGDERTPQRKLRELLYAVEMEQTLGKGRILQLYLALAPWGQNTCGAENAAQRYLRKSASALTPAEAAWLAGLLTNPDRQLQRVRISGVDAARTARIVQQMRPMSAQRRQRALAQIPALRPQVAEMPAPAPAPTQAPAPVLDRTPPLVQAASDTSHAGFASP